MTNRMIRTPREWDEQCHECRGTGVVHKREHFALWTPDEYMESLAGYGPPTIDQKHKGASDVPVNALICCVHAGASIFEACKEGVALALAAGRPVAFAFNDTVAICHVDSEPDQVSIAWSERMYGGRLVR